MSKPRYRVSELCDIKTFTRIFYDGSKRLNHGEVVDRLNEAEQLREALAKVKQLAEGECHVFHLERCQAIAVTAELALSPPAEKST